MVSMCVAERDRPSVLPIAIGVSAHSVIGMRARWSELPTQCNIIKTPFVDAATHKKAICDDSCCCFPSPPSSLVVLSSLLLFPLAMSTSVPYTPPVVSTLAEIRPAAHRARRALTTRRQDGRMHSWTGQQLIDSIEQMRMSLMEQIHIQPKQVIALSLVNSFEFVFSFFGVTNVRGVSAPLNPSYTYDEVKFYLEDMSCTALIIEKGRNTDSGRAARQAAKDSNIPIYDISFTDENGIVKVVLERAPNQSITFPTTSRKVVSLPQPLPDDRALILHTSGTTSKPKAVPLTHRNLCRTLTNVCRTYRLTSEDTCMVVMPLFHVHGLMACLLSTLVSGGCCIIPEKFSAGHFWQDFHDGGATWYSAVPTIHQILLAREQQSGATSSAPLRQKLKFIRSCSSALAPATWHALERVFGVPVIEAYAMSEASHQMTSNELPPGKRKSGSVGRGQGVDVKILDSNGKELPTRAEGEICVRGENVTKGYLNNPSANAESYTACGFFRTGDQGYVDEDGFVFITGRLKELINRGGEKIAPLEVDAAMLSHPDVGEAIAFGMPDEKYGQEVAAAIVPKADVWAKIKGDTQAQAALAKSIQQLVTTKLSPFKVPKKIFFNDSLPKTATGNTLHKRHTTHTRNTSKLKQCDKVDVCLCVRD